MTERQLIALMAASLRRTPRPVTGLQDEVVGSRQREQRHDSEAVRAALRLWEMVKDNDELSGDEWSPA